MDTPFRGTSDGKHFKQVRATGHARHESSVKATAPVVALLLLGARSSEPDYCAHYEDWKEATGEADELERRNANDLNEWPPDELRRWADAMDRRGVSAGLLWDAAPSSADWNSVRQECSQGSEPQFSMNRSYHYPSKAFRSGVYWYSLAPESDKV